LFSHHWHQSTELAYIQSTVSETEHWWRENNKLNT